MLTKSDLQEIKVLFQKEITPVKKDIVKIRKDVSAIVNFFDREYLDLRERVEKIESRLGITHPYA